MAVVNIKSTIKKPKNLSKVLIDNIIKRERYSDLK